MSIIASATSATDRRARRGCQRAARAPYAVGDHARVLFYGEAGTSLALAAPVTLVAYDDTRPAYPWRIVVEPAAGLTHQAYVNARGVDRHQYIEPAVTTMTLAEQFDPAAAFAVELATQLRRAGVVGPLAHRTPDALHVVEVRWSSVRVRARVIVEAHNGAATFTIRTYPYLREHAPEREAYTVPHALGVLLPALL